MLNLNDLYRSSSIQYAKVDFTRLDEHLKNLGREIYFDKGITFQPRKGEILIVTEGNLTIQEQGEDAQALGLSTHYMPIGLLERHYPDLPLHYKAEGTITAIQLSWQEFDDLFLNSTEFSHIFSQMMLHQIVNLIYIYYERNAESGYVTIRRMLYRYVFNASEQGLSQEGIAAFILRRTRLSRSYVFQILSSLKAGGYITVKNGRLLSIDKNIPERY